MPRLREEGGPDWDRLYELAEPQAGYVTIAQALEAGYSHPLVHYYVRKGRLERVSRGIYRVAHFPASEHEDLVVVWLWSEQQGVFSHETALALHELSDALPHVKNLTVPTSWQARRLRVPKGTELTYADLVASDWSWVGPVPVTTPLRTVVDCASTQVDPKLVEQAITESLERGLFSREALRRALADGEHYELLRLLRPRASRPQRAGRPRASRSSRATK